MFRFFIVLFVRFFLLEYYLFGFVGVFVEGGYRRVLSCVLGFEISRFRGGWCIIV